MSGFENLVAPPRAVPAAVRTRAILLLLRAFGPERLKAVRSVPGWALVDRVLRRGELQIAGGLIPHLRLAAEHFDYTSPLAHGVLTGTHEPMVQEALRRTVWPAAVVLDLGANIGGFALLAAYLVGSEGRVICVEPQHDCVEAIRAHARANGFSNVLVLEAAAAAASGETEIVVAADPLWTLVASIGEHPLEIGRELVRAVSIDDLVQSGEIRPPTIVKIDVEGSELEVLRGMTRVLTQIRPVVIGEMHAKNAEFGQLMRSFDYEIVNLDGPEAVEDGEDNIHVLCTPPPPRGR